jgi:hypothetical protein
MERTMRVFHKKLFNKSAAACLALACAALFSLAQPARPASAAPPQQETTQRAISVGGTLNPAGYHYLGLEPSLRDGTVVLTIALEPADDVELRDALNFMVLTDDGLRRVLAGADPFELDIAASAPLQFDPIGNKYQAVFNASGRGAYTVIVYNTGGKIGSYTLTALNGVLLDDADQVRVLTAEPAPLVAPSLAAATTPTETMEARVSTSQGSPLATGLNAGPVTSAAPSVDALRLSGTLDPILNRHFLSVKPAIRDGDVALEMVYEPRGRQTDGAVNFYILDEDALRRFVYGTDFDDVELAAGVQKPFSPNQNDLVAEFTASGSSEYTIVPFSQSPLTVTYVLQVDGGLLVDRYGQTNEAAAARAEFAALSAASSAAANTPATTATLPVSATAPTVITSTTAAPGLQLTLSGGQEVTLVGTGEENAAIAGGAATGAAVGSTASQAAGAPIPAPQAADSEPNAILRVTQIEGALPTPYAHQYWSLVPAIRDGVVVLTMDYSPRGTQELDGRINFWVVDEDGVRRIISGARPEDVALAAGSPVVYGVDKGKLQAAFQSSGKGQYAVIVYNDSAVPAAYNIVTTGGVLLAPAADSDLVQVLP